MMFRCSKLFATTLVLLLLASVAGCGETSIHPIHEDGDTPAVDGDFEWDMQESDGDAEPESSPDGDSDGDSDGEPDNDTDNETDDDTDAPCTCEGKTLCCDGCHPVNENGACNTDRLDCTTDVCRAGVCEHEQSADSCIIENTCLNAGEANPRNVCEICLPYRDRSAWTPALDGTECNDLNTNTHDDACRAGVCSGITAGCDCGGVADLCCDGCNIINEGGDCAADGLSCSRDVCQGGFCAHPIESDYCLIGGACFENGAINPANTCETCRPAVAHDVFSPRPDGSACFDADPCTVGDACVDGVCTGSAKSCPAPDQCRNTGVCDPDSGLCGYSAKPDGTRCTDDVPATVGEHCEAGVCVGEGCECSGVNACCDGCHPINHGEPCEADGFTCTSDRCTQGACTHEINDGFCLIEGRCIPAGQPDLPQSCVFCDPASAPYRWTVKTNGTPCEDGNPCTSEDGCFSGVCLGGETSGCPSDDQCLLDGECRADLGSCSYPSVPDGQGCDDDFPLNDPDQCVDGACVGEGCSCSENSLCCDGCNPINPGGPCSDDGLACTLERCSNGDCDHLLMDGWCVIGGVCYVNGQTNPKNACQTCDPARPYRWSAYAEGTPCDDRDSCTVGDACTEGVCVAESQTSCPPPANSCLLAGECSPFGGLCDYAELPDGSACDDSALGIEDGQCKDGQCVADSCECSGENACCDGCMPINQGGQCADDGLSCTEDECNAGACIHTLKPSRCLIGASCYDAGQTNPLNDCMSCQPAKSPHLWQPLENGDTCDDGNACTLVDSCESGVCIGASPKICQAVDACHLPGVCNPQNGACSQGKAAPDDTPCTDGNACNGGDRCQAGACTEHDYADGLPPDCEDDNLCTIDSCVDETVGYTCYHAPLNGNLCDDGLFCNGRDTCEAGVCVHEWPEAFPPACDDENDCTDDACDEGEDAFVCTTIDLTGPLCDDGNPCTLEDLCAQGACIPGELKPCDGDTCRDGYCDTLSGECVFESINEGGACNDLSLCTLNDTCVDGQCLGTPKACATPLSCQTLPGTCRERDGYCEYPNKDAGELCDDGDPNTGGDHCDGAGRCIGDNCVCDNTDPQCCEDCVAINDGETCTENDGLVCTVGHCNNGYCSAMLDSGWCLIGGECILAQTPNPANPCQACQPNINAYVWSAVPSGTLCTDGISCNGADTCNTQGVCTHQFPNGVPPSCNDFIDCTRDGCSENNGGFLCTHQKLSGTTCDDGLGCNGKDLCDSGACTRHAWPDGLPPQCDDDNVCTEDACTELGGGAFSCEHAGEPMDGTTCPDDAITCTSDICLNGACTHPVNDGRCLLSGVCYTGGDPNPLNDCLFCDDAYPLIWSARPDGTSCADDGVDCTADACEAGICTHDDVSAGFCHIDNTCYPHGVLNAADPCQICDSTKNRLDWSPRADNTPCTDDQNECTRDVCLSGACAHQPEPVATPCASDGLFCTADACDGSGSCAHIVDSEHCAIDGACVADGAPNPENECLSCEREQSSHEWSPAPSGTPCEMDAFACTDDACNGVGACAHPIQDDKCLIDGVCVPHRGENPDNECQQCDTTKTQTKWSNKTDGTGCDDGLFCMIEESCQGGVCSGGVEMDCADTFDCTDDICNEDTNACEHPLVDGVCLIGGACIDDGTPNPANDCEVCSADTPYFWSYRENGYACDDADFCTVNDTCDGEGTCTGDINPCNESPDLVCTADTCNDATQACVHNLLDGYCLIGGQCFADEQPRPEHPCQFCDSSAPRVWSDALPGSACNDGRFCSVAESCDEGGACVGIPRSCTDGLDCTNDSCLEDTDECQNAPIAGFCAIDGVCFQNGQPNPDNPCQICDSALSSDSWSPAENGISCDDGLACTGTDNCQAGVCVHQYANGLPPDCADSNPCTADLCEEDSGSDRYLCVHDAQSADGLSCNDANACTLDDACDGGFCVGEPRSCGDLNACTHDTCDPASGQCVFSALPEGTPCEADGDPCTWDSCMSDGTNAFCMPGAPPDCDDDNPCTADDCDPDTGLCRSTVLEDFSDCECDDNLCTADACFSGRCVAGVLGVTVCDAPENWPESAPYAVFDHDCRDAACDPDSGKCVQSNTATQADGGFATVCELEDGGMGACQDGPNGDDGCCEICDRNPLTGACIIEPADQVESTCCVVNFRLGDAYTGCCTPSIGLNGQVVFGPNPSGSCADDGLACTLDRCNDSGFCTHTIDGESAACVIDGICYQSGERNPANPCELCAPEIDDPASYVTWSNAAQGSACDALCSECGQAVCRENAATDSMLCVLEFDPSACDDGDPCTEDACNTDGKSCTHTPAPDLSPCDDGDPATLNDVCISGICSHADLGSSPASGSSAAGAPDGRPDIAFGSGEIFFGLAPDSLFPSTEQLNLNYADGGDVATGDLNRDGTLDLVFGSENNGAWIVFGPPDASSTPQTLLPPPAIVRAVCIGDVNGDSLPDILLALGNGDSQVMWNNPDHPGVFDTINTFPIPGHFASACAIADMNGDGFADVLIAKSQASESDPSALNDLRVFFGQLTGDGNYYFPTHVRLWTHAAKDLAVTQFDPQMKGRRDSGLPDVVVSFGMQNYSHVIWDAATGRSGALNSRSLVAMPSVQGASGRIYSGAYGVALLDYNHDGLRDLAFTSHLGEAESPVYVGYASGQGYAFQFQTSYPTWFGRAVAAADLGVSATMDLVYANAYTNRSYIYYSSDQTRRLNVTDTPNIGVAIAGGLERYQGRCQCLTASVCCDGCAALNEGRSCYRQGNNPGICDNGACRPPIEAWYLNER